MAVNVPGGRRTKKTSRDQMSTIQSKGRQVKEPTELIVLNDRGVPRIKLKGSQGTRQWMSVCVAVDEYMLSDREEQGRR